MKITDRKSLTRLVVLGVVIVGAWWALSRTTRIISPSAAFARSRSIPVKVSMKIEAGDGETHSFEFPQTPGRLYGSWSSKGASANIKGATDDTLVAFKLIGPD